MTNEEYVRRIGILYEKILSLRKDEDYVVNQPQMDKLVKILELFMDSKIFYDAEVQPVNLVPREEHGGVTVSFVLMSLNGEEAVRRFCDVMSACSAIGVDTLTNGKACLDCTVPNVFVEVPH